MALIWKENYKRNQPLLESYAKRLGVKPRLVLSRSSWRRMKCKLAPNAIGVRLHIDLNTEMMFDESQVIDDPDATHASTAPKLRLPEPKL
jgi:hypothetical protein